MTILDQIVSDTRDRLRDRKRTVAVGRLEDTPVFAEPRRAFGEALRQPGVSVIAEIKRASPSQGVFVDELDVPSVAASYERNGAAALSVLTEPDHFLGSLEFLGLARSSSTIPLLRKDFIVDPYQVVEARAAGADAILLIATVLDRGQLAELLATATELDLEHLVEVHTERELDKLDFGVVKVVGANNRDLETFEVDVRKASRVLRHVPETVLRVAESGIFTPDDLDAAAEGGADAVLVGEALMRSEDPGAALEALLARQPRSSANQAN